MLVDYLPMNFAGHFNFPSRILLRVCSEKCIPRTTRKALKIIDKLVVRPSRGSREFREFNEFRERIYGSENCFRGI